MKVRCVMGFAVFIMLMVWSGAGQAKQMWSPVVGMENNMVVFGKIIMPGFIFQNGKAKIFSFGPGGESDCRAMGDVKQDGTFYMTVVGEQAGELITLKGIDDTERVLQFTNTLIFHPDETLKDVIVN